MGAKSVPSTASKFVSLLTRPFSLVVFGPAGVNRFTTLVDNNYYLDPNDVVSPTENCNAD